MLRSYRIMNHPHRRREFLILSINHKSYCLPASYNIVILHWSICQPPGILSIQIDDYFLGKINIEIHRQLFCQCHFLSKQLCSSFPPFAMMPANAVNQPRGPRGQHGSRYSVSDRRRLRVPKNRCRGPRRLHSLVRRRASILHRDRASGLGATIDETLSNCGSGAFTSHAHRPGNPLGTQRTTPHASTVRSGR